MLLTMKPVIYAANVSDADLATGNAMSASVLEHARSEGSKAVIVSAQVRCFLAHVLWYYGRYGWSKSTNVNPGNGCINHWPGYCHSVLPLY